MSLVFMRDLDSFLQEVLLVTKHAFTVWYSLEEHSMEELFTIVYKEPYPFFEYSSLLFFLQYSM